MKSSNSIRGRLLSLREDDYASFQRKIVPSEEADRIIGVRVPKIRDLAKTFFRNGEYEEFLNDLPHAYYEEDILHACLISMIKDFNSWRDHLVCFLPFIKNWAVCDTIAFSGKINEEVMIPQIREWIYAKEEYSCRLGVELLMKYFLDKRFQKEYLSYPCEVRREDYYANMMLALYYATALAKQWDDTIPYLQENRLGRWVHNKTIQKARESFRISDDQKTYLKTLIRKEEE